MAFPVDVQNQQGSIPNDAYYGGAGTNSYGLQQQILQSAISAATSGGSNFGNLYALNGGFGPQPGKAMVIRALNFTATNRSTFQVRVGVATGPLNGINIPEIDVAFAAGGVDDAGNLIPHKEEVYWVIRNGQSIIAYITKILNGETETGVFWWPNIFTISDDFNYGASDWMAWFGTSITNGTGPTSTAYMYSTLFCSELRKRGKSVKNEWFGISGSTTASHYTKFTKGEYDIMPNKKPPAIVFIELAVNDASSGGSSANYTSRLRIYAERMLTNPENKKILVVILGGTPLENTTAWNNLLVLDAAAQALVETMKETYPGRIFYMELHSSFTRTDATTYISTDTAGQRIHPSDQGNADIFNNSMLPWLATDDGQTFVNAIKNE